MKHVGLNVASDALMTMTLTGVAGGLVVAVADDVGLSSSQNEQDSRYWGASRTCRCSNPPTRRKRAISRSPLSSSPKNTSAR